jgi:alkylation response protein AidB-like acyl-CoA dehydrogenase
VRGPSLTQQGRGHVTLSVAQAKAIAHRAALSVSEQLFDACGARAAHAPHALDRFWRNARTHALHDPLDYKLRDIGRFALEGVLPQASLYA